MHWSSKISKSAKIHVSQPTIRSNAKHSRNDPVISVKTYNSNDYGNNVLILCQCCKTEVAELVYSPERPLSCGAKVWINVKDRSNVLVK